MLPPPIVLAQAAADVSYPSNGLLLTGTQQTVVAALRSGLREPGGCIALTGEAGLGKTTLLDAVLFDPVGKPVSIRYGRELRHASCVSLDGKAELDDAGVLVIEDAHAVPAEALRRLNAVLSPDAPKPLPSRMVFAGRPEFWSRLKEPGLSELRTRITAHIVLFPLLYDEAERYVEHLFALAGFSARAMLTAETLHRLLVSTQGNPRRINTELNAMLAARTEGAVRTNGGREQASQQATQDEAARRAAGGDPRPPVRRAWLRSRR